MTVEHNPSRTDKERNVTRVKGDVCEDRSNGEIG